MRRALVIGSRGSKLALWQAEQIQKQLCSIDPQLEISIEVIKTTGDVKRDPLSVIGGKGVFTKELEDALFESRIDLAVHSLKDLPTILPDGLSIGAICERADPRDALVLKSSLKANSLKDIPDGSLVGTSSQRRMVQLKEKRPDLTIKDVRGNVDTRIRKLDEGEYDALLLAVAGLNRLELSNRISLAISIDEMLPAVGQGAIGVETRAEDQFVNETVSMLDHRETRQACLAERSLLRNLGGGCQVPIAAHARLVGQSLYLEAMVANPDGSEILRGDLSGPSTQPEEIGLALATQLNQQGASSLLNPGKP